MNTPNLDEPPESPQLWLRSQEVRKKLHLTTCELAHLRTSGGIVFRKSGNAYLYSVNNDPRSSGDSSRE
ncbi:MAG: hypothetical protein U0941_29395 [Planctomycetaceae bacterium]